jgi:hypothetical protein
MKTNTNIKTETTLNIEAKMVVLLRNCVSVVLLTAALAGCGMAQQVAGPSGVVASAVPAEDLLRYIRDEHRRHVRLSTGTYAYQCFTDDDLRRFHAARAAEDVARAATRSSRFRAIVAAVAALPIDRQRALLSEASQLAHPTWEELGRITSDGSGQTWAGATAEREISQALVNAVREVIAAGRSAGDKQ